MAKQEADGCEVVKVMVKRAVVVGGIRHSPVQDGKTLRPTEAKMSRADAEAQGKDYVEIIGEPAAKAAGTPKNRQATPPETK